MIIRLDTHTHTIASDHAYSTVLENAAAAGAAGMEALGITDHTKPLEDAPNVMHFQNLRAIDRELFGVSIMRGAELNICDDKGDLFIPESTLRELDYCIASIHPVVYASDDVRENMRAYVGAMDNSHVKIIGHPDDGRVPVDYETLVRAARDTNTLLELNNSSIRPVSFRKNSRENLIKMLKLCERHMVSISLGSDAHIATAVGRFQESLKLLEEVQFPEELVANTSVTKFQALIGRKG